MISGDSITIDFTGYKTVDAGTAEAGPINALAPSGYLAYSHPGHTFTIGYQYISGDTPIDYAAAAGESAGTASGKYTSNLMLPHTSAVSDFNAPRERSWSLAYAFDAATVGLPGLSFFIRYVEGDGIDETKFRLRIFRSIL